MSEWTRSRVKKLINRRGMTKAELGRKLDLSRERVRQLCLPPMSLPVARKYWAILDQLAAANPPHKWTPEMMMQLRQTMSWSQRVASKRVGISVNWWSPLENGTRPISPKICRRLDNFWIEYQLMNILSDVKKS